MKNYILDASVLGRFLVSSIEKEREVIREFIKNENHKVYSIDLINVDVRNIIRFAYRDLDRIKVILELFKELKIEILIPSALELDTALEISFNIQDTVYDAAYHSIALYREMTFITLDKKYFNKAYRLGNIEYLDLQKGS